MESYTFWSEDAGVAPLPTRFRNILDETVKALAFCQVLNTFSAVTTDACCRFRQARTTITTAGGKVAKSARCCPSGPSRCFATCMMVQWAPHSQCTLAFCLRTCGRTFYRPSLSSSCSRVCLLHDSRLLGLILRPSAPVFCCHRVSWTRGRLAFAQEAVRCPPSLSVSLFDPAPVDLL